MKSFKHKMHIAGQFSISDWLALAEAWWLLFFFHLASRWISYERFSVSARSPADKDSDSSQALIVAQKMHRLVGLAARLHFAPMNCLMRSLALQRMLHKRNIPAQVRIGVNKDVAEIYAHAWVEVNGFATGEYEDISERFKILSR